MNTQRIPRTLVPLLTLVPLAACVDDGLGDEADLMEFRAATPASDDPLPQAVLDDIDATLPENQDATVHQPQLFPANFDPNPEVVSADTDVWVTFAQEGAAYQSALGYFTYPAGQPPASLTTQELEDGLLFANASEVGSGGNLYNGVRMHLGTFQPGVQIGFYLVQNGSCADPGVGNCSSVGVDFSKPIFATVDAMNPEYATDPSKARHVVLADLLNDPAGDARLLSFEDQGRLGNSDDDFNDVVFRVTASPALGGDVVPAVPGAVCDPNNATQQVATGNWGPDVWRTQYPDLNNDGLADLCTSGEFAAPNINPGVYSYCAIGDGTGQFSPFTMHKMFEGNWGSDVWDTTYPDINGDGLPDMCTSGAYLSPVGVQSYCALGDGSGSFGPPVFDQIHSGNWGPDIWRVTYPDIDGNGLADLCVSGAWGELQAGDPGVASYCAFGDGTGHFGALHYQKHYSGSWPSTIWKTNFADLNGDDKADLCISGEFASPHLNPGVYSYCAFGDGTGYFGTFNVQVLQGGNWGAAIWDTTYPDINDDGLADVCTAGETGAGGIQTYCHIGLGTGFFGPVVLDQVTPFPNPNSYSHTLWETSFPDIDGDGRADVCAAAESTDGFGVKSECSRGYGTGEFWGGFGCFP